nr:MAG TPA: hypothetical protein [Caudoviricetes sp.]
MRGCTRPSSQGNGSSTNCGTGRIPSAISSTFTRSCSWRERTAAAHMIMQRHRGR